MPGSLEAPLARAAAAWSGLPGEEPAEFMAAVLRSDPAVTAALAEALHREDITGRAIHEEAWAMQVPSFGADDCQPCHSRAAAILDALLGPRESAGGMKP